MAATKEWKKGVAAEVKAERARRRARRKEIRAVDNVELNMDDLEFNKRTQEPHKFCHAKLRFKQAR